MILNKDLLFIHVPKTGGTSVSYYLMKTLSKPVFYFAPHLKGDEPEGIIHAKCDRHMPLLRAKELGIDAPLVLVVIRNPYDLVVSRYHFLRHVFSAPIITPMHQLALDVDFETFAIEHTHPSQEIYFLCDGELPRHARIVKFEKLDHAITSAARDANDGRTSLAVFPHKGISPHKPWQSCITPAAEEAIYQRNRWVFDNGYYDRRIPKRSSACGDSSDQPPPHPLAEPLGTPI